MSDGSGSVSRILHPKRLIMIRIFHNGVHFQQFQIFHQTSDLLSFFKSSVTLNWFGWREKSLEPVGSIPWKMAIPGRLHISKGRNTCNFVTLTASWVSSSKNTAMAMKQRTQTQHPQQNLSCLKAWLPHYQGIRTRSHPPHIPQKRLLVSHSLQLVRFFFFA